VRQPAWTETVVVPTTLQVSNLGSARKVWTVKESPVMGALIPLGFGSALAATGVGAAVLASPIALGLLPAGLVFVIIGLVLMRSARRTTTAVAEYDDGFAALVGGRTVSARWTAVKSITSDEVFRVGKRGGGLTYRTYVVELESGERVVLEQWFMQIHEIIALFKERVGRALLPAMKADYDAGKVVTFDGVHVSRDAIEANGRRIAWGEVANAAVKSGELVVTPKNGSEPLRVRVSRIPNIEQLCELIGVNPLSSSPATRARPRPH
jgi:hypothetical protein